MRLGHRADAAKVGRLPVAGAGQQLGQRAGGGLGPGGARVLRQQLGDLAAQHRGARGLEADDRDAGCDHGVQGVQAAPQLPAGAVELAGSDPGQAAAHRLGRDLHRVPGRLEHPHGGPADLGGEVVGERIHPQQHRRTATGAGPGGEPGAEGLRGEPRERPPGVDPAQPLGQAGQDRGAQRGVRQPGRA